MSESAPASNSPITWSSGLSVDADGSPHAYAPASSGLPALDFLRNAGTAKAWFGLACNSKGEPYIQGSTGKGPASGYYISATALVDHSKAENDCARYVDSETVPYISVPRELHETHGVKLGDVALVEFSGNHVAAVVADISPRGHYGEGSIALARGLGVESSPKHGGVSKGVAFSVWAGSSRGWPRTQADVARQVDGLLAEPVLQMLAAN